MTQYEVVAKPDAARFVVETICLSQRGDRKLRPCGWRTA